MEEILVYGFELARISEVYLSTLSSIMTPQGLERFFYPLLYLCGHNGELTQTDLADALKRDKVQTMRIVDYLCEKELIMRKPNSKDRRCQFLEVTSKGRALAPKIKKAIGKTDALLFQNLSTTEKQQFKKSLEKIKQTINTLPDSDYILKAFKRSKTK